MWPGQVEEIGGLLAHKVEVLANSQSGVDESGTDIKSCDGSAMRYFTVAIFQRPQPARILTA
jgi:hypothetical protein